MATTKRTYGDRCGVARALDIVGERWALLVVRELLLGPKRFTDLRAGLPHVGPDILAQRLRELEQSGIVRRGTLPPPAGSRIYELTERGRELEPIVVALGRFGSVAPFPPGEAQIGVDAVVIALKSLFDSGPRRRAFARATSCAWASSASASTWATGGSRSPAAARRRPTPPSRPTRGRWPPSSGTGAGSTRRGAPGTSRSRAIERRSRASSGCSPSPPDRPTDECAGGATFHRP